MKKIFFLFPLLFPILALTQDKNEELLDWSPFKRLTWNDYKGKPDSNSDAAATTTSYLGIKYNFKNNSVTYKIICRFSKNKSWGLHKTDHILSHEQGHFDITEIFARKLNKKTGDYKFNKSTYQKDLQKIYDDLMDEKEMFQNRYDEKTDFSRNKEKQAEWLKKIEKMLDDLKDYSEY
ncbi:MAG: DUF922 domain-containing protein [Bacteroidia bacterium]|nr:DUF922 domain-containing protein [Bacteroidia bacterium]